MHAAASAWTPGFFGHPSALLTHATRRTQSPDPWPPTDNRARILCGDARSGIRVDRGRDFGPDPGGVACLNVASAGLWTARQRRACSDRSVGALGVHGR